MSSGSDSEADSETSPPVALHLGDIVFATSEWESLASIGELRVGPIQTSNLFISDFCLSLIHADNIVLLASLGTPTPEPKG